MCAYVHAGGGYSHTSVVADTYIYMYLFNNNYAVITILCYNYAVMMILCYIYAVIQAGWLELVNVHIDHVH